MCYYYTKIDDPDFNCAQHFNYHKGHGKDYILNPLATKYGIQKFDKHCHHLASHVHQLFNSFDNKLDLCLNAGNLSSVLLHLLAKQFILGRYKLQRLI